jgi:hypothetical protein
MLVAVGGASFVWPAIALTILRPRPSAVLATLALPLLLAAASTPAVALARAGLLALGAPPGIRLPLTIVAGVVAFGGAVLVARRALLADLARLKEALPEDTDSSEDEGLTDVGPVVVVEPAPVVG